MSTKAITAIRQAAMRGECQRRMRIERYAADHATLIIEEEDSSGDGLFENERATITVAYPALKFMLDEWANRDGLA